MSSSSPRNAALDQSPQVVIADVLQQAAERSPDFGRALLWCAVPRWFDADVVQGMFPANEATTVPIDELVQYLSSLPFAEPHSRREKTWVFREEFRQSLLNHEAVTKQGDELQLRAAAVFRKRLDARASEGERKFDDPGLKDAAIEYVYHLYQLDPLTALKAVRQICAETLAVLTTAGGRPEVVFCSRFLGGLDWPIISEQIEQELSFLRTGISALLTENDVKALKMLYELVEVTGLTAEQESALHAWIGEIHLWNETRLAPALEQFKIAEQFTPKDATLHARIAEVYYTPGPTWGRFDLAEEYALKAVAGASDKVNGYEAIAGTLALGQIAKLQKNYDEALALYQKAIEVQPKTIYAYLPKSEVYSEQGELDRALTTIDEALKASPDIKYYALVRRGNAYREARRYEEALREYGQARDEAPDRIDAYIEIGQVQSLLWQVAEAEETYRKAIGINPEAMDGYDGLARLYEQQGKVGRAIDECENAKKKGIASKQLYIRLVDLYRKQDRLEDLQQAQQDLLQLDPAEKYANHCGLGDAWLDRAWRRCDDQHRKEWLTKANWEYEEALAYDSRRAWAHISLAKLAVLENDQRKIQEQKQQVNERSSWTQYDMFVGLGRAFLENFQYSKAEKELRAAVELAPRREAGWLALGDLYYQQCDQNGVMEAWTKLVGINPTLAYDRHMRVGDSYHRRADYARASEEFDLAKELQPETYEAYWALAETAEMESNWDEAIANYRIVTIKAPGLASIAYVRIARILLSQEKTPAAEDAVRTAIQLDREEPLGYIELARLGVIQRKEALVTESRQRLSTIATDRLYDFDIAIGDEYRLAKHYEKAEQAYKECIRRKSDRAEAYIGLGKLRLSQERPQGAEEWLPQALEIDRTNVEANLAIAEMYEKLDRLEEAEQRLETAIELMPWHPDAYLFLGSLKHRLGNSEEARKAYEKARDAAGVSYLDLGSYYELKRKLDDAIEVYRIGLEYEPPEKKPDFHTALASLYARQNNPEQAKGEYRQAIALDPSRLEAYERLAQLLTDENRISEAVEVYMQMAQQPELTHAAQIHTGDLFAEHEKHDEAMQSYRQAMESDPIAYDAYLRLAQLLDAEERVGEALEVYDQMATQPDLAYAAQVLKGNFLADHEKYDEAEESYLQAIKVNEKEVDAYIQLALLYRQRARLEETEQILHMASEAVPNNPEPLQILAQVREQQERWREAIELYRRVAELEPVGASASEAHQRIGDLLAERMKQYDEAKQELQLAVQSDPMNAGAHYSLGTLYQQQGLVERALESYAEATEVDPKYADAHVASLSIYSDQKDTKKLGQTARKILELDLQPTERYDAFLLIGDAYRDATDTDQAATFYRQALALNPKTPEAYVRLAQLLANENRVDEALKVCRQMAKQPELAYNAYISIGNLLGPDNYAEAAQSYRQAIEIDPGQVDAYLRLASLYHQEGKTTEIEQLLLQATEAIPENPEPQRLLAELREQQQRWDEAIKLYRRVLEMQPGGVSAAELHQRVGILLIYQKRYSEAERELLQAKQSDPDNADIYLNLGAVYDRQAKVELALENYTKATEIAPKYGSAYRALGAVYAKQGDIKKLAEMAQNILGLDLDPTERYEAYMLVADAYRSGERYDLAIDNLNEAVSLDPTRLEAHGALGRIYEIQQRWLEARDEYKKIVELDPESQSDMHLRIGYVLVSEQKPEEAEKEFRQFSVETLRPNDERFEFLTAAYIQTAAVYRTQGKLEAMGSLCAEVASLVKNNQLSGHNATRQLGLAHLMRGESGEAAQALRQALEVEPDDVKARLYLAVNSLLQGDRAQAQSELKQANEQAQHQDDYKYAIEEAEVLAARVPEVAGASEMVTALREASQNTAK